MEITIELTREADCAPATGCRGRGNRLAGGIFWPGAAGRKTTDANFNSLHYEAYEAMAEKIMREKIALLEKRHPCQAVRVVHRLGEVPVGEAAIYVGIRSRHRGEGFRFLQEFMDELKQDVPIWKRVA